MRRFQAATLPAPPGTGLGPAWAGRPGVRSIDCGLREPMATVLLPLPSRDFDPTEVAVSWDVLRARGHQVVFATPDGNPARADDLMVTGRGLDPWGAVPGLRHVTVVGRVLRANADGRKALAALSRDVGFLSPVRWDEMHAQQCAGLLLPGGHRARGMRPYLESPVVQRSVVEFFSRGKPVAAVGIAPVTVFDTPTILLARKN